jgi:hypothetical protein
VGGAVRLGHGVVAPVDRRVHRVDAALLLGARHGGGDLLAVTRGQQRLPHEVPDGVLPPRYAGRPGCDDEQHHRAGDEDAGRLDPAGTGSASRTVEPWRTARRVQGRPDPQERTTSRAGHADHSGTASIQDGCPGCWDHWHTELRAKAREGHHVGMRFEILVRTRRVS